jgi:Ca2+-binding RTX toxin-like protein
VSLVLLIAAGALAIGLAARAAVAAAQPDPVSAAWERARATGSYHFESDITQVAIPSPKASNVGRGSRTTQLHLAGQTDLAAQTMEMRLWSDGGSVLLDQSGTAVKVEQGKTYMRRGAGDWQATDSLADGIAPQGDFMAYLSAVRDIRAHAPEVRAGLRVTRYSFTVDGPAFAMFVRDQVEQAMRARGALAPGASLAVSQYYRDMTGDGELWVAENGLPVRQILNLTFPEQGGEALNAQITVDFSQYGAPPSAGGLAGLLGALGAKLPAPGNLLLLAVIVALVAGMLRFQRSRQFQKALALFVITSVVLGPLLQSLGMRSFLDAQTAEAAEQEQQRQEGAMQRSLLSQGDRPAFSPHANPLAAAEPSAQLPASAAPAPHAASALASDSGADGDQDGLTDYQEQRVGTDPAFNDSDEDGIPDAAEVRGFQLGGKTWYLNATVADSNGDGIADSLECWRSPPPSSTPSSQTPPCDLDTDADGVPDLFDADNDGDGVPDRLDLAMFTAGSATFGDSSPLKLTLNNLEPNVPTFVDFQIRPTNENHLWFALNVLDWPHDQEGQIQDKDDVTFADSSIKGDMKLIPMLEIRIHGTPTNLPDQSVLTPYNIVANDYTSDHATKAVYVPLNIMTDERTGARVAFAGRMRYLPGGSWPAPHEVRLAWVVQALIDLPCDHSSSQAAAQGCAEDNYVHNVPQVVQTYYDDWKLAGLNVSENHGAKTAIIYEDPAADTNKRDDASLVSLSHGLDNSFLAGRDQDGNGMRDIDIDEIARRFDRTRNAAFSSDQRWGLDDALNSMRVERRDYPTFDQAASFTVMTDTLSVLNAQFDTSWASDHTIKPTLMFAYEQRSRSIGLDGAGVAGGYVTLSDDGVTVDMQPAGQQRASVNTLAGLKWAHYCRSDQAAAWAVCDAEAYWNELESRYSATPFPGDPADPDLVAGRTFVTHVYDLALSQGITSLVQQDTAVISGRYSLKSDSETAATVRVALNGGGALVTAITNEAILARYVNKISLVKHLGNLIRNGAAGPALLKLQSFSQNRAAGTLIVLAGATVIGGLATAAIFQSQGNLGAKIALKAFILSVQTFLAAIDPILTLRALKTSGGIRSLLMDSPEAIGFSKYSGAVGAVIAIGVTWGFFIYSMVSNNVSAFSPEFNRALAETIAATIYLIVLAILSATVIGTLLVGLVTAIDAILTSICELGVDDLRNVPGLGGACFTLGTSAIKAIAYFLYNYDLMIDTSRTDMVGTGAPRTTLADPNKGFVAGNLLSVTMPITTHVVHKSPDPSSGIYINLYLWLFSKDNLRSSTFKYSLTQPAKQDITSVSLGQMSGAWQNVAQDHRYVATPMYGGYAHTNAAPVSFDLPPGVNRPATFYLNMGYALPAYECWAIPAPLIFYPLTPVCYTRTFKGHSSSSIETMKYDILPATIDEFMAVGAKPDGGLGLAWDAAFPSLADPDGDGLFSNVHGGLDPNDGAWDADNDGLSDTYELERGRDGLAFSAIQCDTDNDGLADGQEAQFGSNPAIADSDNDGLADGQEVWHQVYDTGTCAPNGQWSGGWDVAIDGATTLTVHVSSDPIRADGDGDGISDQAEQQLAQQADPADRVDDQGVPYNPNVFNTSPIKVYPETDRRFVQPGQTLPYTTTVVADVALAPSMLDISAPSEAGGPRLPATLAFDPNSFNDSQTVVNRADFSIQGGANGQQLQFTSDVRARLAPTGPASRAWDPITFQGLGNISQPTRFMAATPYQPSQQDSFLISTLTSSSASRGGQGELRTSIIPSGQLSTQLASNASWPLMGDTPPDSACNNSGTCMVVWDERDSANSPDDRVYRAIINADGSLICCTAMPKPSGASTVQYRPVVASDGTNFMIAYAQIETSGGSTLKTIQVRGYDSNGAQLLNLRGDNAVSVLKGTTDDGLSLVWSGSTYFLAWKAGQDARIFGSVVDSSGEIWTNGLFEQLQAERSRAGIPVLAGNPINGNILMLYQGQSGEARSALFNPGDPSYNWSNSATLGYLSDGATLIPAGDGKLSAAFDSRSSEWLVSANGRLMVFDQNLFAMQLPIQDVAIGSTLCLACAARISVPAADLRFEELPGATSFGGATCADGKCPAAGLPGATDSQGNAAGTPASDYAVQFDGGDDELTMSNPLGNEFSLAFWYKAATGGGTAFYIESGQPNGFGFFTYNDSALTEFYAGGTRIAAPTSLHDGQWHFVVATRANSSALAMYLDGNLTPVVSAPSSPTPAMTGTIRIGGGSAPVGLDNLQLYNVALSGSMVQALYKRTAQSYCVAAQSNMWAKINASLADTRGGKISASGSLAVTVDGDQPASAIGGLSDGQHIQGNQVLTIGGSASDPTSYITGVDLNVNGGGWQPASGAGTWAYNLAVAEGGYAVQTRATDAAGNVEAPGAGITLIADATPPQLALTGLAATPIRPTRNAADQWTVTLSGSASDPSAGGWPGSGVQPGSVEVLLRGQGGAAQGNGWQTAALDGSDWTITYAFDASLADPTGAYTVLVRAVDTVGNHSADDAATGTLLLDAAGPTVALSTIDATRQVISDTLTIGGVISDTANIPASVAGVDKLEIAFTPVEQIAALPIDITSEQADAQLNRTWLPASVAQRGAGVGASAWSVAVPAGLENEYQIDLRATDMLGNVLLTSNAWRGLIDTLAPRITVSGTRGAVSWFDYGSGQQMYDIAYTCTVTDRYLDEHSFGCPTGGATAVRTFDINPALQALFPDRTIRNGLTVSASYWWPDPNVAIAGSGCDAYGHCASGSSILQPAGSPAAKATLDKAAVSAAASAAMAPGAPLAVVVAPTRDSFVASDGALSVTVAAEAGALLKQVTISLDNADIQTIDFAQSDAVTRTLRTVSISGVGEGPHTLAARASDWANAAQSNPAPVAFTLDAQPPAVTIDPATLTSADTWQQGSGILRFNGTASDSIGLAAVQIREGASPFSDVEFANGTWQTALPVQDPEGRTLTIVVRAIDRAGRVSEATHTIGTDLSSANPPDTSITSRPADPSATNTASFEFAGTPGAGGPEVVAFECQLDDGAFAPCASPQGYDDLSKGGHTFRVRAVDGQGFVDLSPASFTWTVSAVKPETFITAGPPDPSSSRTASISFNGDSSAARFECALDGGSYSACTTPQQYADLADGRHTLLVRARDGAGNPGAPSAFSWTVVNAAPVAASQSVSTDTGATVAITLAASDSDPLTYRVVAGPAHGVLQGIAPNLGYLPDSGFSGTDQFSFVASDGQADSNVATVTITVMRSPSFSPGPDITVLEDSSAYSAAWASDISAGTFSPPLDFSVTGNSNPGLFSAGPSIAPDGRLSFTPALDAGGSASITVVLRSDDGAQSLPHTFTITITPVNDLPTIALATGGQCVATAASGTRNLTVADVDGDALSLSGSSSNTTLVPAGGIVFGGSAANRSVTISAAAARSGNATITVTVDDGNGGTAALTITMVVGTNGNDSLTAASGPHMIFGLGGNDTLTGGNGSDLLCGGSGNDRLNDTGGDNVIDGGAGNDQINSGAGNDLIDGGAGNDQINGGDGNDTLAGGDGNDQIKGDDGNDTLSGGNGNDRLSGGLGADFFSGGPGNDNAADFNTSQGDTRDSTIP